MTAKREAREGMMAKNPREEDLQNPVWEFLGPGQPALRSDPQDAE